jgi:hypothetical protein
MDITLQEALAQLEGYTSTEVAELMELAGKKGERFNSVSCPVANYLEDVLGAQCSVGPYNAYVVVADEEDRVLLPKGVSWFVSDFDRGGYPHLHTDEIA